MKKTAFFLLTFLVFGCQSTQDQKPTPETALAETDKNKPDAALNDLFEEVNVVKMHLFGTTEEQPNADQYPYVGKPIPAALHSMLDKMLNADMGPVFACYRTENSGHYILRVPGKYISGDLALAKWDAQAGKLVKVTNLAYYWCDEGVCNQMDAWLADLDDDRNLELICREHHRDEKGNVSDEKFTVTTDDGSGVFQNATTELAALAIKNNYVMK